MNYALDALWWRLTDSDVRALASLLTAPPLWHTGCELPVRELLGEHGFRALLALDEQPAALQTHLAAEAPFGHRLGLYAESLLAFWLDYAPHTQLLARNLAVSDADNGRTLGALDFVATLNGRLCHLELTCKYYGSPCAHPEQMVGLNRQDRLVDKAAKLRQQLAWSQHVAGRQALAKAGISGKAAAYSLVRGIGFAGENSSFTQAPLNPHGWHGLYLAGGQPVAAIPPNLRYHILPHMNLLAPARVGEQDCHREEEVVQAEAEMIALLEQRPDGFWHETARLMKAGSA